MRTIKRNESEVYFGNDFDDNSSEHSTKTINGVVLLWDVLKVSNLLIKFNNFVEQI